MQSIGEEELAVYIASICLISTRIINHDGGALDSDMESTNNASLTHTAKKCIHNYERTNCSESKDESVSQPRQ
jgi:thymidine phosphorylase